MPHRPAFVSTSGIDHRLLSMTGSSAYPFVCARRSHLRPNALVACASKPGHGAEVVQLTAAQTLQLGLLCGAVAGFSVEAILFPLDTLKTRLQVAGHSFGAGSTSLLSNLYRGFSPAVLSSAPSTAVFFATYDYAKREFEARMPKPTAHFFAAALGDVTASAVKLPFEIVKQQLQSGMHDGSLRLAVSTIWKTQGAQGFLSGYGSLLLRDLPFDALQFPLYEFFKSQYTKAKQAPLNTFEGATCGSLAGSIAGALTTPIDVVKTRLMTQSASNPYYHGVADGLTKVAREEGVMTLFSGVVPRVVWLSVGGFVFFGAYEATRRVVLDMHERK